MSSSIIPGSLSAIAQQNNTSIAETFINCDVIIIVDTSGSMASRDSRGGLSRYDVACEELAELQRKLPGKIAVISFSDSVAFCPAGIATFMGGNTDLAAALRFVKIADVPDMHFILISDGQPDSEDAALGVARTFKNHIDVIYVGPENYPMGRDFLARLAHATGGKAVTADRAMELQAGVLSLIGSGR
jgi:Mg-chelatase subunit ChlD